MEEDGIEEAMDTEEDDDEEQTAVSEETGCKEKFYGCTYEHTSERQIEEEIHEKQKYKISNHCHSLHS